MHYLQDIALIANHISEYHQQDYAIDAFFHEN